MAKKLGQQEINENADNQNELGDDDEAVLLIEEVLGVDDEVVGTETEVEDELLLVVLVTVEVVDLVVL